MQFLKLSDCAYFSNLRTSEITLENYISTENMLPDRGGIILATSLPPIKTAAKYERNDILISNIRPYFKKIWYADHCGSCSNDVLVIKAKNEFVPLFLYYVLSDDNFFNYATVTSQGAKMPRGTPNAIMKYLVPNMTKCEQGKVADILSKYDALIENNNKRIAILEQMAENLYKEWFVRFRFPGHERVPFVDSPLGKIPSTFSVVKMNDVISYYIGGGWGNDERDQQYAVEASVIRGTDFPFVKKGDLSTCPLRYHKETNFATRQLKDGDIVLEVSGGTAEQPVGRTIVITKNILERFNHKAICASFCKLIRLNKDVISPHYFACWMDFLYAARIIDKFQLQSTGISNFQFEYFLRKGNVLLPPKNIMLEFEEHITRYKQLIDKLAQKNDNIIKQRDMLLPRLINGTLEIKL